MNAMGITNEQLMMLLPLVALQLGLAVFCAFKILREGVANLNKGLWLALCFFLNLIGPALFLTIGRKKDAA